ncbi:PGF-pre-PGF domain-containing protein [Candidatus Woesearchaeota archaeon]|nr:MAG: PGF-pre-PGF domain-containing protein [Candidatus Woesearchaeota archaeon]
MLKKEGGFQMNKQLLILLILFIAGIALAQNSSAANCWDYNNDKDGCLAQEGCKWDFWGKYCYEVGCWDFWTQESCEGNASSINKSCVWRSEGSTGWCEEGAACWNYHDNASCTAASNCVWDGTAYCAEKNCWNYYTQEDCENHSDIGCVWDGWNCVEQSGCWEYSTQSSCDNANGCMWKSDEYCGEEGCWNYQSENSCNAAEGCVWHEDQWGSWCEEADSCWSLSTQSTCEAAGCYWDSFDSKCTFKDCFMFSGTNSTACVNNNLNLTCSWQNECHPAGPGGESCWSYTDEASCNAAGCEWGSCVEQGCWDYMNQTTCEANNCVWDQQTNTCTDQGCWNADTENECNAISGCAWMSNNGWCEEEACHNYNDKSSCEASSLGCAWQNDSWGGYCYEQGCWDQHTQQDCESLNGCVWDNNSQNCYEPGCWDYTNESTCEASSSCEWVDSGSCVEQGCWSYTDENTCTSNNCTWGGGGWCEDRGCWNYKTQLACDNNTACQWNYDGNYCEEVSCGSFTTNATCSLHSSDLNCVWDGFSCYKQGCWNYNNQSSCQGDTSCIWNGGGQCFTKECWNYKDNATCSADSDCAWSAYCDGDYSLECWNYNDNETACVNAGCAWKGNCYERGCGSYTTRTACCGSSDCTESNECGWEEGGYCQEVACWNYYTEASCINVSGCLWNNNSNYCYEVGCWNYTNASACNQQRYRGCAWNEENNYCYKQDCWEYTTEAACNADANGIGNCAWDDEGSYCYSKGCWAKSTQTDCEAQTGCEWVDSGWCYDLGCWNYATENDCTQHSQCSWDSTWEYCYEKGCWEYTNESACNASSKCKWDTGGSFCYEQGCWNYLDNTSCTNDNNCFWDANAGWCSEGGCWDYMNQTTCEANNNCVWDSNGNYCYEKGCWAYNNESSCTTNNCSWNADSGGWCYEQGCWDHWDNESCLSAGCLWDSTYGYCYEEGCWAYNNETSCSANGCTWRTETWGWCEEQKCWDFDNNQTACENPNDSLNCIWNDPYCEEVACWAFDNNETACNNSANYGLNCTYSDPWCEPAEGYCSSYDGNEYECIQTDYCWYDFKTDECKEPVDTGNNITQFNPGCWLFWADQASCENVSICQYNGSDCVPKPGFENTPVQCENITDKDMCNKIPALGTCCRWRNGQCTTDYIGKSCHDKLAEPPEGATFCEDYNSYQSQVLCEQISGPYWFMPCKWDGQYCTFNSEDVIGSDGDVFSIKTKGLCEKAGYSWKCEEFCNDNNTASTDDDFIDRDCWCDIKTGASNCQKSCWACETQNNGSAWSSLALAQAACESSPANCEFTPDPNAPNGFGTCDFSSSLEKAGSCDTSCAACNDIPDDPSTAKHETKIACLQSKAECKWDANLANLSQGTCVKKSKKTCLEKCFECSEEECASYGLGSAGSCVWVDDGDYCKPKNFNDELCFNDKDDDNDGMKDCDDPDCFFDPSCGEGDLVHECWKYNTQALCNSSPVINGSSLNCTWITDEWGESWCGHPSEVCWKYDYSETECNNQNGACRYKASGGNCDVNKTKADSCIGKAEGGCTGNCVWVDDPNNPAGGFCDFKMFALCHNSSIDSQSKCTNGNNQQYCYWRFDPNSPNGGWCEPKCFSLDNTSCSSNPNCEWRSGWCEPNMTTSEDCYQFDNNQSACEQQAACLWSPAEFGGECEPSDGGVWAPVFCDVLYNDEASCSADGNCTWITDPFNPDMGGFCENKAFACFDIARMAFDSSDGNSTAAANACNNASSAGCTWISGNGFMGGECRHVCWRNSSVFGQDCNSINGCEEFTGWCDPKGAGQMFDKMDAPPTPVGMDDCPETGLAEHADICGMGVKDDFDIFGFGINVVSMLDTATCNGEFVQDMSTWPPTVEEGTGSTPLKAEFYLDSNGISTGGCNSSNNAETGFEFKFVVESTQANKEKVSKYECVNGNWETTSIEASTMAKVMCGEAGGPVVMADKESLDETGKFDLNYNIRLYALTKNISTEAAIDSVSGIFTPGAVDFMKEDCFGVEDTDGDNLPPDKDPDCKFIKKFGGMVFEDCWAPGDEDQDGMTNCDDPDCFFLPDCGGELFDFTVTNDTTMATIASYEVTEFPDSAFVSYSSSEPANGTLLFYYNDSTCNSLNATIYDKGITDSSVPAFRIKHKGKIDDSTLGYSLTNGTTYYYKLKVCDKAGNPCGVTACLNFTTEASIADCGIKCQPVFDVNYVPPEGDSYRSNTQVQWNFGSGFQTKGCGGKAFKKSYNETENVSVKFSDPNASAKWGITLEEMDIKGVVDPNKTSLNESDLIANETDSGIKYVGMDHDAWEDLKDELNPETITICVPGNVDTLYHCPNESAVSVNDCTDVTDYVISGPTYDSSQGCTNFEVPADLGFSVYFGQSSGTSSPLVMKGDSSPSLMKGGGGSPSLMKGGGGSPLMSKGGNTTGTVSKSKTFFYSSMDAGNYTLNVNTDNISFTKIKFVLTADIGSSAKLEVRSLDSKPTSISDAAPLVYNYLEISPTNLNSASDIKIEFRVLNSWITSNGVSDSDVMLYHLVGSSWNKLATTKLSADSQYTTYEASTPSFSYFAIGAAQPASPCNNNGVCDSGETSENCAADCLSAVCNNNSVCDSGETTKNCPSDCPEQAVCNNNGICDSGETSENCPADCPPPVCNNDGTCSGNENTENCPADCPAPPVCNNNGKCEGSENVDNCPNDCKAKAGMSTGTVSIIVVLVLVLILVGSFLYMHYHRKGGGKKLKEEKVDKSNVEESSKLASLKKKLEETKK